MYFRLAFDRLALNLVDASQHACDDHPHLPVAIYPLSKARNKMDFAIAGECIAGPMPVRDFLDKFLPVQSPSMRMSKLPGFKAGAEPGLENQIHAFVGFAFAITAYRTNTITLIVLRIDSGREFGLQQDQSVERVQGSLLRPGKQPEVHTRRYILRRKHE